jgi:phage terminase Nu1 subunit (DNA packaging protein)
VKRTRDDEPLLERKQLAEALDVFPGTITRWVADGCPVAKGGRRPGSPRLYSERDVRAWLKRREEAAQANVGTLDPIQERARRDRWTTRLARQQFVTRKRQLLPADEVASDVGARVAAARAKFHAVPSAYAARLHRAAITDGVPGAERLLQQMVRDVLRDLAAMPAPVLASPQARRRPGHAGTRPAA